MQTTSKRPLVRKRPSKGRTMSNGVHTSQLMDLFEKQLKDILWAEKALIKAIPKMISLATSVDLIVVLSDHLQETHGQITRLTTVFREIDKKPSTKKCDAMEGLIAEAIEMMEDCDKGPRCDAGIIAAAQKIEHYEIATYGTLREFAVSLGLRDAELLFLETLKEEKDADRKLTQVAVRGVNMEAVSEQM